MTKREKQKQAVQMKRKQKNIQKYRRLLLVRKLVAKKLIQLRKKKGKNRKKKFLRYS